MSLPYIRGTQIGLRNPGLVDQLKSAIATDQYAFHEDRGQIGGVIDAQGTYHVIEGHHRMVAAMEFFQETGNNNAVIALLFWGRWSFVENRPAASRPLPSRALWGAFRNWLGF